MQLARLAKRVRESFGLQHSANLGLLRHYIKTTDEDTLVSEIFGIKDSDLLRTLWEAGLSARLQGEVLEQLKKL